MWSYVWASIDFKETLNFKSYYFKSNELNFKVVKSITNQILHSFVLFFFFFFNVHDFVHKFFTIFEMTSGQVINNKMIIVVSLCDNHNILPF